jgi:hypothetical protein
MKKLTLALILTLVAGEAHGQTANRLRVKALTVIDSATVNRLNAFRGDVRDSLAVPRVNAQHVVGRDSVISNRVEAQDSLVVKHIRVTGSPIGTAEHYTATLTAAADSVNITVAGMTTTGRAVASFGEAIFWPIVVPRTGLVTVRSSGNETADVTVYLIVMSR